MEIQLSFQWIPLEISIKHQRKSIGNRFEIAMKIMLKFQWHINGNPFEIQFESNTNFNEIPVGSFLMIYQLKSQCYDNKS